MLKFGTNENNLHATNIEMKKKMHIKYDIFNKYVNSLQYRCKCVGYKSKNLYRRTYVYIK